MAVRPALSPAFCCTVAYQFPIFPVPHFSHSSLSNLYVCPPHCWDHPFPRPLSAAFRAFASCPGAIPFSTKTGASLSPNLWILLSPILGLTTALVCPSTLNWTPFPFPECDCLSQGLVAVNTHHDQCNSYKDNI